MLSYLISLALSQNKSLLLTCIHKKTKDIYHSGYDCQYLATNFYIRTVYNKIVVIYLPLDTDQVNKRKYIMQSVTYNY